MTTKNELAEQLTARGIALPANWGKMSLARAQAFADIGATTKPSLGQSIGRAAGAIVGAVLGLGAAAVEVAGDVRQAVAPAKAAEPVRRAQTKAATMPKDPKWKRTKGGGRGWYPSAPSPLPEVLTRQLRRQLERREDKMPLGASQTVWHKAQGFGKVGLGKRRLAAA